MTDHLVCFDCQHEWDEERVNTGIRCPYCSSTMWDMVDEPTNDPLK